jgi:hypothetical protein
MPVLGQSIVLLLSVLKLQLDTADAVHLQMTDSDKV